MLAIVLRREAMKRKCKKYFAKFRAKVALSDLGEADGRVWYSRQSDNWQGRTRGLIIQRLNQVWVADMTCISMACGFAYLIDCYSCKTLSCVYPTSWRQKRRLRSTVRLKSSLLIRGVSSPVMTSPVYSKPMISISAWMAGVVGCTMCLWNGCGEAWKKSACASVELLRMLVALSVFIVTFPALSAGIND